METMKTLNRAADNIRILSAAMVEKAKSGHPGGAMGGADFTNALYAKYLVYDPDDATISRRKKGLRGVYSSLPPRRFLRNVF